MLCLQTGIYLTAFIAREHISTTVRRNPGSESYLVITAVNIRDYKHPVKRFEARINFQLEVILLQPCQQKR